MGTLQDLRTSTWAFLEVYGWMTVFVVILIYILFKKYIYDLMVAREEERRLIEQKKFDRQVQDREADKMRLARQKQQREHDEKEKIETSKREEKLKEEAEKRQREYEEQEKTCNVLGHSSSTSSVLKTSIINKNEKAIKIVENIPDSAPIVVFGESNCPEFRKVCQLVSTYRLDISKFQVFEHDKQSDWPGEEVLKVMENRFKTKKSPYVFVCGEFIGGLEGIRNYDRTHGLDKVK
ncbi:Glutaredoxin domain-containing protein [Caenorhabditis elegans]|uniref:Glutaredoxin domain-containing protein n=2 Tax=Caenorhabditis elegans TaxID=6239 RepID=Q19822_CAEEL|nr:Glutaredoxin domain-containing protein [Caenorhabditis elegans]CCD65764.1 Glutaredoxin domain-containing protein [Caenorhabditis elegans]|eukprot:NP_498031.3 Uncharacterized protein CELE_F26F4.9 [Caenorhabditis elegans]